MEFCQRLGIANPFRPPDTDAATTTHIPNPDEIDLESSDSENEVTTNLEKLVTTDQGGETKNEHTFSGSTEGGVSWSIERRPGLKLPEPTTTQDTLGEGGGQCQGQSAELDELNPTEVARPTEPFKEKLAFKKGPVLKRRNQALYTATEDHI